VGLGAGALSCFARPGERITFFEIDPVVARIARDPDLFTYLRECPADVVIGDGRLSLEREPPGRFGLVILDAFNSDAIPVHLLTREALELYLSRAGPRGAVLVHISNRYVDLEPVLGNFARADGFTCVAQTHDPNVAGRERGYSISHWALLTRERRDLGLLAGDPRWDPCDTGADRVWTDDYSDLLGAIDWG
jgi:hypothetical protein